MHRKQLKINWTNTLFLTISPLIGVVGTALYTARYGVTRWEIIPFFVMVAFTGLSITGGYHRLFAHRSYKANPLIKLFYLVFGACATENSALHWTSDHRNHHRYVDTDLDPYNAKEGFFHSHIGWIFFQDSSGRSFDNVRDLQKDPLVMWQDRYYIPISIVVGGGVPMLLGAVAGHPLGGFLWGGALRLVLVHHMTFLINSWAHIFGNQPYSTSDTSRDCWWLAFLTNGEGYHNFHHKFQADYRNGVRWFQWDPTKWLVWGFSRLGWTQQLNRVPHEVIMRARLDAAMSKAEANLTPLPSAARASLQEKLVLHRGRLAEIMANWSRARARYIELRVSAQKGSEEKRAHYKVLLRKYRADLRKATAEWREILQAHSRQWGYQTI